MVAGVINQSVGGIDNAPCAAVSAAQRIYVALMIFAALLLRQLSFVISEVIAADALAGRVFFERAAGPAQCAGFLLRDEIVRQVIVGIEIERHIVLRVVGAVLINCERSGLRLLGLNSFRLSFRLFGLNDLRFGFRLFGLNDLRFGFRLLEQNNPGLGLILRQESECLLAGLRRLP